MPIVKISLRKGRSAGYYQAILDGVHSALVGSFKIPDSDRNQLLYELDPDHLEIASTKSDQFVVIEIIVFPGRSSDAKKKLFAAIVKNLEKSPGIPGNDIVIVLHEPPMENWGIRGGRRASEVDVGFRIDV